MNKKGSAIVEAAMVFPVVILAVMSVIGALVYFYVQIGEQVEMHMVLRSESGAICENLYYSEGNVDDRAVYRKNGKLYCYGTVQRDRKWLMPEAEKQLYAEKYILDDTLVIRTADLMKEGAGNEQ